MFELFSVCVARSKHQNSLTTSFLLLNKLASSSHSLSNQGWSSISWHSRDMASLLQSFRLLAISNLRII